jgi:hypothetical protein
MKKLLGLSAITALFVLTACGESSDETVCTMAVGEEGIEMTLTAQSEDGEITSIDFETRLDISELDEDFVEMMIEEDGVELDGGYIVSTQTVTPGELSVPTDLDEFIEELEDQGATCN